MANGILQVEIVDQLAKYIKANVSLLNRPNAVIEEWPNSNQQLDMPCLSILTGNPKFSPWLAPYVLKIGTPDPVTNIATVDKVVGEWDYSFQLDFWCRNKVERAQVWDAFFKGFNKKVAEGPMGLSLQLQNYYNIWCRYDISDLNFMDNEASSQTQEWRAKVVLLSNVIEVLTTPIPVMKTITIPTEPVVPPSSSTP